MALTRLSRCNLIGFSSDDGLQSVILLDNIISREFYNGKLTQAPQAKRWYSEVSPTTLGTFFQEGYYGLISSDQREV